MSRPGRPRSPRITDEEIRTYCPAAGRVFEQIQLGTPITPVYKKMVKDLKNDWTENEESLEELQEREAAYGLDEHEKRVRQTLQAARHVLMDASSQLIAYFHQEHGIPHEIPAQMAKAFASAHTGSGPEHALLAAPDARPNTKSLVDLDRRARILVIAELAEREGVSRQDLYAGFLKARVPEARYVVERRNDFSDPTLAGLIDAWRARWGKRTWPDDLRPLLDEP